jgi:hypothetical protein
MEVVMFVLLGNFLFEDERLGDQLPVQHNRGDLILDPERCVRNVQQKDLILFFLSLLTLIGPTCQVSRSRSSPQTLQRLLWIPY